MPWPADGTTDARAPQIEDETTGAHRVVSSKGRVTTVAGLLDVAGVDVKKWVVVKQVVNKWEGLARGSDGEPATVPLYQVKVWLERRPAYYMKSIKPVQAIRRSLPRNPPDVKTCLVLPDAQIGFRRKNGKLEPFHDRAAMDLALQAVRLVRPDHILILGDWLDFPELSRFTTEPDTRFLIQPALVECAWYLQALRLSAPSHCEIVWLEGNHELRLRNSLLEHHAGALADVRSVGDLDGPPAMSVEKLLHLDELSVNYVAPYGTPYWLFEDVLCHHGHVVRGGGGKTAGSIVSTATHHHIVGHIHRREICSRTLIDPKAPNGQRTISAMSPGALCSTVAGVVPSGKGRPSQDWQQGLGLVHHHKGLSRLSLIPIDRGGCVINGAYIEGDDRHYLQELTRATGIEF